MIAFMVKSRYRRDWCGVVTEEMYFENSHEGLDDVEEDIGMQDEGEEEEYEDDIEMDFENAEMEKKALRLSLKNAMMKKSIKKLISIAEQFELPLEEVNTTSSMDLIELISNHCVDSDDNVKLLVEALSTKDSDEEFSKSQYKDQLDHLKLFNLKKLYYNLVQQEMEPISDGLTKELEKDKNGTFHDLLNQFQLKMIIPMAEHFGINFGQAQRAIKLRVVKKVLDAAQADKAIEITIRDYVKSYKLAKESETNVLKNMETAELVNLCKKNDVKIKNIQTVRPVRLKSVLLDDFLNKKCTFSSYMDQVELHKEHIVEAVMKTDMSPNDLAKIIASEILLEDKETAESTPQTEETTNQAKTTRQKEKEDRLFEKLQRYFERKRIQLQAVLKYLDRQMLVETMTATCGRPGMELALTNQNIRDYLAEYGAMNFENYERLLNAMKFSYQEHGDMTYAPTQISIDEAIARRLNIPITQTMEPLSDLITQMKNEYSISNSIMDRIKGNIETPPLYNSADYETTGIKFMNIPGTPTQNR